MNTGQPLSVHDHGNCALCDQLEKAFETRSIVCAEACADARALWKALQDLSFECDSVIAHPNGRVGAPTVDTYNRTFEILDKLRDRYSGEASKEASKPASPQRVVAPEMVDESVCEHMYLRRHCDICGPKI